MEDSRLAKFATDPKFRTVPKKQKKLKIDPRFQHVFKDKRFDNRNIGKDKRGRPIPSHASKESYEQFYRLDSSGEDSETEERSETLSVKSLKSKVEKMAQAKEQKQNITKRKASMDSDASGDEISAKKIRQMMKKGTHKQKGKELKSNKDCAQRDSSEPEDVHSDTMENNQTVHKSNQKEVAVREKLHDLNVDYARGEGVLASDSSSEEESSSEDDNENNKSTEEGGFDKWGELDHDAGRIADGEETNRLAVCNLDWDRVGAADIYVALSSFCPTSGKLVGLFIGLR